MRYEVKLTTQAIEQIQEIVQYISKILLVPETAQKWLDSLQCEIRKLDSKMPFKNFLVYYLIDEDKNSVWVTAVIYGRRNQITALMDMSLGDKE